MARLRGEELPGFLEVLQTWLPQQPWFSAPTGRWTLRRTGGLRLPAPEGDGDPRLLLELHIFEVPEASEGAVRISVPLVLRSRPSALAGKNAFVGRLTHEDLGEVWLYDGARDRAFLAAWLEMARREQGTRNGRAHGEAYSGFSGREAYTVRLRRTTRDTERITRTLITPEGVDEADWENRVVVDFLRRPEAGSPEEYDLLEALATAKARRIPHLLGVVSGAWEVDAGEQAPAGEGEIVWEYGDLALIREGALAAQDAASLAAQAGAAGGDFTAEAQGIGRALGDAHADFAAAFGAYPQTAVQAESAAEDALAALDEAWAAAHGVPLEEHERERIEAQVGSLRAGLEAAAEPLMLQTIHGALTLNSFRGPAADGQWMLDDSGGVQEHALPLLDASAVLAALAEQAQQQESFEVAALVRFLLEGLGQSDADSSWTSGVLFLAHSTAGLLNLRAAGKLTAETFQAALDALPQGAGSP